MKNLFCLLTLSLLALPSAIYSQDLIIHFQNESISYPITSIDSITFAFNVECPDTLIDERDGQMYQTIQINNQCWMAENLNYGQQIDGVVNQSDNEIIEKYCYDDDGSNCEVYGGLYQWDEIMQYTTIEGIQGICPQGWHVPTDDEWFTLEHFLDPTIEPGTYYWRGYNCGQQLIEGGSSGFESLFGGRRLWEFGEFSLIGEYSEFWTSSLNLSNPTDAAFRLLQIDIPQSYRNRSNRNYGLSLRCLKNF